RRYTLSDRRDAYTALATFLRSRVPPRSPLFPYTTLFRSSTPPGSARCSCPTATTAKRRRLREGRTRSGRPNGATSIRRSRTPAGDRKSTRLNSSHVKSSYAVFCLKKKKHTTYKTRHTMKD